MSTSKAGDPRLGSIIKEGMDGDIVLIGFPYDEGCVRNGGRAGASFGPKAFRTFVKGMGTVINPELGVDLSNIKVSDSGDVSGETLEDAHKMLEERVLALRQAGKVPFVVGGGNDQSAPNGRGLIRATGAEKSVSVINIDAHLDVRPKKEGKVHSGTPFRELLEDGGLKGGTFCEFACQGVQCSAEHASFVEESGGELMWYSKIEDDPAAHFEGWLKKQGGDIFVSFDIDAIQSADCPGVSCPANYGLTAKEALRICQLSGACPSVQLFDMSEMNPVVEGHRTPRLAVLMFYHFLVGYSTRV